MEDWGAACGGIGVVIGIGIGVGVGIGVGIPEGACRCAAEGHMALCHGSTD